MSPSISSRAVVAVALSGLLLATTGLVACGGGSKRLDIFARGPRGDMLHKRWDGKSWTPFESLGRPPSEQPDVPMAFAGVSLAGVWGRFQLDVFARAADGKLYHTTSNGTE